MDITLDLDNKKVSCAIDGKDIGKSINDIEGGAYRLIVSMYFDKTEVELL